MNSTANPVTLPLAQYAPRHFLIAVKVGVATVTLNRARAQESADIRELSRAHGLLPCLRVR